MKAAAFARRLTATACLAVATAVGSASADDGWREDFGRLSHYSGLTCPERIGALERTGVSGSEASMLASCTYQSGPVQATVQLWEFGTLAKALAALRARYTETGFREVGGSGALSRGLNFMVDSTEVERRETILPISLPGYHLLVWMHYRHPAEDALAVASFSDLLAMLRSMR